MGIPAGFAQNIPSVTAPLVEIEGRVEEDGSIKGVGKITRPWLLLLQALLAFQDVGSQDGVTATGLIQDTAAQLGQYWNVVTSTPANSGVRLPTLGPGNLIVVWNFGGNNLLVYPFKGSQIDALGNNNPYTLANGKCQIYYVTKDLQFRSLQLG